MAQTWGAFFKKKRLEAGLGLREFCTANKYDPGNISKLERGVFPVPTASERLEGYANSLKLTPGSEDWLTFFDLAAAEAGKIPADILSNEELIPKLPLLFRTLRGQRVEEEDFDKIVEIIRRS